MLLSRSFAVSFELPCMVLPCLGGTASPAVTNSEWIKLSHCFQFSQEPLISNKMQYYLIYNNVIEDLTEEKVIQDPMD